MRFMDRLDTLDYGLAELRRVIGGLDDAAMDGPTNCEPWSVRRLASHALNNQLVWAGLVTGQQLVAVDEAMGAVAISGDLEPVAVDVTSRASALWHTGGVLDALHMTPFGELPGSVVIDFAIIDAAAHSWDLSTSVGRPLDFDPAQLSALAEVVAATCTDGAREHGLIKPRSEIPADATDTERLMSAAGRTIRR
jgi:uncharacterized protein (TIGR03086 family)